VFARAAAAPDRADGMNDPARGQGMATRESHLTGRAAAESATLLEQSRARGAVNRAVHAAAAEQARVGGVDDGIDIERRDVVAHELHAQQRHVSMLRTTSQRPSAPSSTSTARLNARWSRRFWTQRPATKPASAMPVSASEVAASARVN